jgi:hypothetical protein
MEPRLTPPGLCLSASRWLIAALDCALLETLCDVARIGQRIGDRRTVPWRLIKGQGVAPYSEDDTQRAQEALARHIANKYRSPGALGPDKLLIDEVMAAYLKDYAQHSPLREFLFATARPTLQ